MSTVKNKVKRNRCKLMDDEEDSQKRENGNEDINTNNIQKKQKDMFDSYKLGQNMINQIYDKQQFDAADICQQQQSREKKDKSQSRTQKFKQQQFVGEVSTKKVKTRKNRKQKKHMISDDDIQQQNKPQKNSSIYKQTQQITCFQQNSQLEIIQQTSSTRQNQMQPQQEQSETQDAINITAIITKRQQQNKTTDNYVVMHELLNQAGIDKQQLRFIIYSPLKPNQHSFVYFKRCRTAFTEYFQIIGQDLRPILFCQNQNGSIGCNYYFSLTKEMNKHIPAYLGKLRGNAAGSMYQLYDNGQQPTNEYDRSKFRANMAYIQYETNLLGMNSPRKLKIIIPNAQYVEDFDMYKFSPQQSLSILPGSAVCKLRNKMPKWNEKVKSFTLNFGNRVKQASLKNFILIEDKYAQSQENQANNILAFGKTDQNTFFLQFRHPLSLFQAFGITMSQFDFKLGCE